MYRKYFKRLFEVICSLLALIVLTPLLLVTAILVRIKLGSPVIFKQKRPGLHEKIRKRQRSTVEGKTAYGCEGQYTT